VTGFLATVVGFDTEASSPTWHQHRDARTTRLRRPQSSIARPATQLAAIASRTDVRDDAYAPPDECETRKELAVICPTGQGGFWSVSCTLRLLFRHGQASSRSAVIAFDSDEHGLLRIFESHRRDLAKIVFARVHARSINRRESSRIIQKRSSACSIKRLRSLRTESSALQGFHKIFLGKLVRKLRF
jgi:hypothetical protein